jgi:YbbR domain-containing protein
VSKVVDYFWTKRDDMLLFAFSLLISLLLFGQLQVGLEPGKEREFEVPLSFSGQSDDVTIVQAPRSAKVVASGSQQALDSLDTSKVRAVVDLTDAQPGISRLRVEVFGPLRSGSTLTPVRSVAEVEIERKLRREFEVQLLTVGTPPGNFTYEGVTMLPPRVEVSGPESNVPMVVAVRAVLDLTNLMPNQSLELELEALGEEKRPVPLITLTPSRVQIMPAVSIGPSRRNLLVTPVFTGQPAVGYRVSGYDVIPNQIATVGESAEVSRVTTVNTKPIDLSGLRANRRFTVKLVLPPGLNVTDSDEVTVSVRVVRG